MIENGTPNERVAQARAMAEHDELRSQLDGIDERYDSSVKQFNSAIQEWMQKWGIEREENIDLRAKLAEAEFNYARLIEEKESLRCTVKRLHAAVPEDIEREVSQLIPDSVEKDYLLALISSLIAKSKEDSKKQIVDAYCEGWESRIDSRFVNELRSQHAEEYADCVMKDK